MQLSIKGYSFGASIFLFVSLSLSSFAGVQLPKVFGDHMVLQRQQAVPVWGWEDPNVEVTVSFAGQTKSTKADEFGKWMLKLDAMEANKTGRELRVKGSSTKVFKDVLVGEVWVCSGQSNMEWTVNSSMNAAEERKGGDFPLIRHFKVPHTNKPTPEDDVNANWQVCTSKTVGGFTAVGFFFGRKIHKELDVPVGLIGSNWGGTRVEPWTPPIGFRSVPELKELSNRVDSWSVKTESGKKAWTEYLARIKHWTQMAEEALKENEEVQELPLAPGPGKSHQEATKLYNGMISPLIPYGIRGAIWYQGESNGNEGLSYFHKKSALIKGWRKIWKQGDFPFYYVQLANWRKASTNPQGGDGWAKLREAQTKCLELNNTGMAVIIDIGEAKDIHPRNKQDVGLRLASWALAKDYGKSIVFSGPVYKSHKVEGSSIRIEFDYAGGGLMIGQKKGLLPVTPDTAAKVKHIAIAGTDKKWFWAEAKIDGNALVVSSDQVKEPVAVRYAFSMNPEGANLYNKEGFPASPFRTDNW